MTYLTKIIDPMTKVLESFQRDRTLLSYGGTKPGQITVERLTTLANWHLFDNEPDWFGIEKIEGHRIRYYFETGKSKWDIIPELYETFPGVFDGESQDFMDRINFMRERQSLEPLTLYNRTNE
jgi:hypothetical protein